MNFKNILLDIFVMLVTVTTFAQSGFDEQNPQKAYRFKKSPSYILIYPNFIEKVDTSDYRKLDNSVFFKYVGGKRYIFNGKHYSLITIPGQRVEPNGLNFSLLEVRTDPRNGAAIDNKDYDKNFWILDSDTIHNIRTEYFKYKSDLITGIVTAPFKLRLNTKGAKESYFDGSLNLGGFVGYKLSFGTQAPSYISLIGFFEFTSLTYNSSNNTLLKDTSTQSGMGFSYGLGLIFRFKNVSPGIVMGWDHGVGNSGTNFIYQDHPWISFSLNFDFIKPKQDTKTAASN